MDTGLGRIRGLRHGDMTMRKSDNPTLSTAARLATAAGEISAGALGQAPATTVGEGMVAIQETANAEG